MNQEDHDLLSAYVDGELEPAARAEVQKRLLADQDFNAAHQKLIKLQHNIQSTFPLPETSTAPQSLSDLLEPKQEDETKKHRSAWWLMPLAASVAAVFLLNTYMFGQGNADQNQWQQVAYQLDNVKDMRVTSINDGLSLVVLQSFDHIDGRLCREYQSKNETQVTHGIACKATDSWTQEVAMQSEVAKGSYQTATKSPNAVKAFLDSYKSKSRDQ